MRTLLATVVALTLVPTLPSFQVRGGMGQQRQVLLWSNTNEGDWGPPDAVIITLVKVLDEGRAVI